LVLAVATLAAIQVERRRAVGVIDVEGESV
jgi:hypothetical protein